MEINVVGWLSRGASVAVGSMASRRSVYYTLGKGVLFPSFSLVLDFIFSIVQCRKDGIDELPVRTFYDIEPLTSLRYNSLP